MTNTKTTETTVQHISRMAITALEKLPTARIRAVDANGAPAKDKNGAPVYQPFSQHQPIAAGANYVIGGHNFEARRP